MSKTDSQSSLETNHSSNSLTAKIEQDKIASIPFENEKAFEEDNLEKKTESKSDNQYSKYQHSCPIKEDIINQKENIIRKSSFDDIFTFCYRGTLK
jgi:hypothetical protein